MVYLLPLELVYLARSQADYLRQTSSLTSYIPLMALFADCRELDS
jgi:hypothetical protein